MESSSLAQHLIMGPPKISKVQQLYRQKTKAILKQQMKQRTATTQHITNIQKPHRKVDEEKNISHPIIPQKVTIESKNVSIPVINTTAVVTNENTTAQTKISTVQTTVKATVSNANTVKVQTPVVVNANEVTTKSIKICPARKVITGTSRAQNQTQKLIIVSNSQGNTTSSILQHTLTIPFVKTISMKNLDKLKVINNTNTSTSNTTTTASQKPKLLTVHTKMKSNIPGKQLNIPFIQGVQLQALQNKGAIKMVPVSTTKISTKPAGPIYIMNTNTNLSAVTSSNSSPIMTTKLQNSTENTQDNQKVYLIKNEDIKTFNNENNNQNVVLLNVQPKTDQKSSVLTDILKASGVIPNEESEVNEENEISNDQCDVESQITQFTIPSTDGVNFVQNICEVSGVEVIETDDIKIENEDIKQIQNEDIKILNEEIKIEDIKIEQTESQEQFEQYESIDEVNEVTDQVVEDTDYIVLSKSLIY